MLKLWSQGFELGLAFRPLRAMHTARSLSMARSETSWLTEPCAADLGLIERPARCDRPRAQTGLPLQGVRDTHHQVQARLTDSRTAGAQRPPRAPAELPRERLLRIHLDRQCVAERARFCVGRIAIPALGVNRRSGIERSPDRAAVRDNEGVPIQLELTVARARRATG